MKQRSRHAGFTLMEILITMFIVGLIAVVLFNVYNGYNTVFAIQQTRVDVNGSAREIADEFKKTALQARRVVASHTFSGVIRTSGSTTTVFELPSVNGAGDVISASYDYVAFYATSTDAYKVTDGAIGSVRASSTRHLSNTLKTLTFTYNNGNITLATSTDVDVQTQTTLKGQVISAHVRESARLRNL